MFTIWFLGAKGRRGREALLVAFACFHGVNTPMVADSMLTTWGHRAWSTVRHHELVQASCSPLGPWGASGVPAGYVTLFYHHL